MSVVIVTLLIMYIAFFNKKKRESFDTFEFVPYYFPLIIDTQNRLLYKKSESWEFALAAGMRFKMVSETHKVTWAITTDNNIAYALRKEDAVSGNWRRISGKGLFLATAYSSSSVWLIGHDQKLYYRSYIDSAWECINCYCSYVAVAGDGCHIWIIHNDNIFYAYTVEQARENKWIRVRGNANIIDISKDGDIAICLKNGSMQYRYGKPYINGFDSNWTDAQINNLKRVQFTNRIWGEAYGITTNDQIVYMRFDGIQWKQSDSFRFI